MKPTAVAATPRSAATADGRLAWAVASACAFSWPIAPVLTTVTVASTRCSVLVAEVAEAGTPRLAATAVVSTTGAVRAVEDEAFTF